MTLQLHIAIDRSGDQESRLFFEALLSEERTHEKDLLQWIEKL